MDLTLGLPLGLEATATELLAGAELSRAHVMSLREAGVRVSEIEPILTYLSVPPRTIKAVLNDLDDYGKWATGEPEPVELTVEAPPEPVEVTVTEVPPAPEAPVDAL